ncbi:MAG TPA: HD domain-containing protein [Candidatus Didemnitutus sp.]|nr:HD domain-containing protein [Candidatus Didemnitutus sp.]
MAIPTAIDTKDPGAVAAHVKAVFAKLGWNQSATLVERLFDDTTRLFHGDFPGYCANDMRYHAYEHTLQATVCNIQILQGRHQVGVAPVLSARDAELGLAAVLLHDTGFLKTTNDAAGTGAKYTFVHERRSCEFATKYLPTIGFSAPEIRDVCDSISCTGPRNRISRHAFRREEARTLACILVTADYLAQMSAPDYPDKLTVLYREFEEAFTFENIPDEKRPYRRILDLFEQTPSFWEDFVRPMLTTEADSVFRYLSNTGQPNPYLQAVEVNIAEVRRRVQQGLVTT